jgi:hypothetical protein
MGNTVLVGKSEQDGLRDLHVDWRIILKLNLKLDSVNLWIEIQLDQLRVHWQAL